MADGFCIINFHDINGGWYSKKCYNNKKILQDHCLENFHPFVKIFKIL